MPTEYQASLLLAARRSELRVIHDSLDAEFWRRRSVVERAFGPLTFSPATRIVTYVSRGFESMCDFDLFLRRQEDLHRRPVREVIHHGQTGLLQHFFDLDGFAATALEVLKDPAACRRLGQAGQQLIREH